MGSCSASPAIPRARSRAPRPSTGGSTSAAGRSRSHPAALNLPLTERDEHVVVWQDRENSDYAKIVGASALRIVGTIYCGYNTMEGGGTADQMGSQLIAGALSLHGTSRIGIAYDGRNAVRSRRSVLVE